ncbi:methionine aminotransferase [Flagellimonas myxillae]|uniref:methionine aminotransferase n=1 Tax=Flagellimonas myxillae TaxID=2942214 RepID=UPI00201E7E75|nr:methionine aminotransferase [Muricauda myxillae]MCL6266742.1 methionine aminotransferase [Muricauda myxillae]
MPEIYSKLPNLGTTIFSVINRLANQYNAVNLSQGFPNFSPDPKLLGLVDKALKDDFNQYAPMPGSLALRETLSAKTERLYGRYYHPELEITVTAGATQAIFTAIAAFVHRGDEVIVLRPAYDSYEPTIELFGGKVVPVQLRGKDFKVDWDALKEAITPKTRMLVINTPHNPTGTIWSEKDMLKLQDILRGTDIILLSDEVYEHIVFDGELHHSASKFPDLAARSLICSSFGKTFHVTGWKIGYCVASKALMKEFRKVHQYNVFSVFRPAQIALNTYLQTPGHYESLGGFYQKKRDHFLAGIKDSRFTVIPSSGTYFQLLGYDQITDERDMDLAQRLIKEHQLASIPISVFCGEGYDQKFLRFCFCKTEALLDQAAEILNRI